MTERFINYIRYEKRFSQHTILAYSNDIRQFTSYLRDAFELRKPEDVKPEMIRSWIIHLIESKISNRSINRKISTLKTFYKFLQQEDRIEQSPFLTIISPKNATELPQFLEQDSMTKLFSDDHFSNDFNGLRDKTVLEVLYGTGIRLSELVNLKEDDIDFYGKTLKVLGKRNKERQIPLTKRLEGQLKSYLTMKEQVFADTEKNNHLFVTSKNRQVYPRLIYRIVNRHLSMASTLTKKSPHILRHSFATHMLNNGADLNAIKEILGHANLSATQVYTHSSIGQLKSIHKNSHPREKIKEV
ncbi:MAG: tyrosine-type recombinase/integrase [Bacteroidales bacterium]|nr:tyrosine-type recombinase/integrase [Bacteroidales bacterium]MCF8396631.1 tyrosine-type recombinase/integrase [Bacteroidales bacterium]